MSVLGLLLAAFIGTAAAQPVNPVGPCTQGHACYITGGTQTGASYVNPTVTGTGSVSLTTPDAGATMDNGLLVVQGYNGPGLGQTKGIASWTGSVRFGTETSTDHFCKIFNCAVRAHGQYNNFESVLTVPAGVVSLQNQTSAITATIDDFGGQGVFPLVGQSIAEVNNSTLWGVITVHQNSPNSIGTLTGVRMEDEFDYFQDNASTTVRGLLVNLQALASPSSNVNLLGVVCNLFTGSPYHWNVCLSSGNGVADTAMIVGTTTAGAPTTTGNISQVVAFYYTDNTTGTTQRAVNLYSDPTLAGATGALLRIGSSYAGKSNIGLDNLGKVVGVNAAGTGTVDLVYVTGADVAVFGGGAHQAIQSTNGVVMDFFNTPPSTVNNIRVVGAVSGSGPSLTSAHFAGTGDANIDLTIGTLGTGTLHEQVNGSDVLALTTTGAAVTGTVTTNAHQVAYVLDSGTATQTCANPGPTLLHTTTIPAGTLGTFGELEVDLIFDVPNDAATKTLLGALSAVSGSGGTNVLNNAVTTVGSVQRDIRVRNAGAANSQRFWPATAATDSGTNAGAVATAAIDTSATSYLNLTCTSSTGTESVTVNYTVIARAP